MIVVMLRTILVAAVAALALAPASLAAPPAITSVTAPGGKATVAWTLPAGAEVWTLEIGTKSAVDSDGYFLAENVADTAVFFDRTTSWTSDEVLAPGTYYVHVSGWDKNCNTCPVPEWSTVRSFTVGGSTAPATPTTTTTTTTTGTTTTTTTAAPTGGTTTTAPTASAPAAGTTTTAPAATAPAGSSTATTPATTAAPAAAGIGRVGSVTARLRGAIALVSFRVCGSGDVAVDVVASRGAKQHAAVVTLALSGGCMTYKLGLSVPRGAGSAAVSVGTGGATGVTKPL